MLSFLSLLPLLLLLALLGSSAPLSAPPASLATPASLLRSAVSVSRLLDEACAKPLHPGPPPPSFELADLLSGEAKDEIGEALKEHTFVVLTPPAAPDDSFASLPSSLASSLREKALSCLFELPPAEMLSLAGPPMAYPNFPQSTVGLSSGGGNDFLDFRFPNPPDRASPVLPRLPPLQDAAQDLACCLSLVGAKLLSSLPAPPGAAPLPDLCDLSALRPLDPPEPQLSNTVLRLAHYPPGPVEVTFGAHTDTAFLTLIPLTSPAGLEAYSPSLSSWTPLEACHPPGSVAALSGELLHAVTCGEFRACAHRVVKSRARRVSSPLLLRHRPGGEAGGRPLQEVWEGMQFGGRSTGEMERELGEMEKGASPPRRPPAPPTPAPAPPPVLPDYNFRSPSALPIFFSSLSPSSPPPTVLSRSPLLLQYDDLLPPAATAEILAHAKTLGALSSTVLQPSSPTASLDSVRSSTTAWLSHSETPALSLLSSLLSSITSLPLSHCERFQLARYKPGQRYAPHVDHLDSMNGLACGGRVRTAIFYLNGGGGLEGGRTAFPELGVSVEPRAGRAIVFDNVRVPVAFEGRFECEGDGRSVHSGEPVEGGEKFIVTLWAHPAPVS
jgi:prolyl 4-hydroxylase